LAGPGADDDEEGYEQLSDAAHAVDRIAYAPPLLMSGIHQRTWDRDRFCGDPVG